MKTYYTPPADEETIFVRCNLCGSDDFREMFIVEQARFVKCRKCGLVYQNPQPVFSNLEKRYGDKYFEYEISNEKNFFNLMLLGLEDIDFEKIESRFPENKRNFMDIGCATGMLLAYIKKRGWKTKGVEICRQSAEYGIKERNLDIYIGTLETANISSESFSVVHFSHLIEHVPDPKGFLKEVYRILIPGGFIIVTTPNINGFQARLLKKNWRSAIPDHLFLFSKATLERILYEAGFEILQFVTWGGIAKGLVPSFIKKPIDKLAKSFEFGDVMLFLARK